MSSENSEIQTHNQTVLHCFENQDQESETRLRQLANVFIDMFVASFTESSYPVRLVN
jgi:hypothetical protein